ncbi:MAG: baseplate J/gp47 family protein, partial [Peptostreptococcus sp.]
SILDRVKLNIEKNRPVCPEVTVVAATPVTVNIVASINTTDLDYAIDNFKSNLENYFLDVSEKISYSKLFGCLASCRDVVDVVDFKVNRGTSSVSITKDQVAILGEIQVKKEGD